MLRALDSLPSTTLRQLHQQAYRYFSRFNILRIEWAFRVVIYLEIGKPAPGDLERTGQVKDAEDFLREKYPPPTLSFSQQSFSEERYRGCGGFSRAIIWQLKGTSKMANGYVVQQVQNIFRINRCDGAVLNYSRQTYWEAWNVVEGVISASLFTMRGEICLQWILSRIRRELGRRRAGQNSWTVIKNRISGGLRPSRKPEVWRVP
jgi:hypothetical protein